MRSRGRDQRAVLGGSVAQARADVTHLVDGVGNSLVHTRSRLEHRGHQLLAHTVIAGCIGHLVEAWNELVALVRYELELLLDAEAEGRTASERVLHALQRLSASSRERVS